MNHLCNTTLILLAGSTFSHADVAANFTGGNTPGFVDQYPGIAGSGWLGGWGTTGTTAPAASISTASPVNGGGNYLSITSSLNADNALGRRFDGTGTKVDISQPTTISFDLRIDSLTGWDNLNDYITVHGNTAAAGTNYNVSNNSSFIIRASGASPAAGKNANEWLFYSGAGDGGAFNTANYQNSGMMIAAGTTYTFTITTDPVNKKYSASIFNGTTTASASNLGWRSSAAANSIAFNQKVSAASGDAVGYSIDNLSVHTNVGGQPDTVANFTDGSGVATVDQYKGTAGLGWDAAWATTVGGGGTEPVVSVVNTTPINSSGNYLSVSSSSIADTAVGRDFDGTGTAGGFAVATEKIKTTFHLRVDSLSGWDSVDDYLTVHGPNDGTSLNVSGNSTFIIRAFGASLATGQHGSEWLLYNGTSNGAAHNPANFVNSGMPIEAGKTYSFTIINDPTTKKCSGSISNGTTTVTWSDLGWRASGPSDKLAFNQKVNNGADSVAYSLDNILITSVAASDFDNWAGTYGLTGGMSGDDDNDGLTNSGEYAFGLIPNNGSSANPITTPLNKTAGNFTFQCRDQTLTGLTYSVWTSTDLSVWTKDATATLTPGTADGNSVQQVAVTLTGAPLSAPKLFVQVRAQ